MYCYTEFNCAFKHRFMEIGAVSMPVWVSVFFDSMWNEVYFREDFSVLVTAKDKSIRIDAVLFEFTPHAPSL